MEGNTLADSATIAFARDDDYFFGVLHSSGYMNSGRDLKGLNP